MKNQLLATVLFSALSTLSIGCASAANDDDASASSSDEAAFTIGAVSSLQASVFAEQVDRRPAAPFDARCWGSPIPAGTVCGNPPLPKTDLGTGSATVRIRQYTPGSDRILADVRVVHPSFDGSQTLVRVFSQIELQQGDGGYGPGQSWSARVTRGGLTYRMGFIFPWVGLNEAGPLANMHVRIEDGTDSFLTMATW